MEVLKNQGNKGKIITVASQTVEGGRFGEKGDGTTAVIQLSAHKVLTFQIGQGTDKRRRDSEHSDEASKTWWQLLIRVR